MGGPGSFGPSPTQGFSPEEFKPVPCSACGEHRRLPLQFVEVKAHRFKPDLLVPLQQLATKCLGCGVQLRVDGKPMMPEDLGYLSPEQIAKF